MLTRRQVLLGSPGVAGLLAGCARSLPAAGGVLVNDIQSQLNATRVARVVAPASADAMPEVVARAVAEGWSISVAGGRHAMGGQQFGAGTVLLDTTRMRRVLRFDAERGQVEVEAGIQWPELIDHLLAAVELDGEAIVPIRLWVLTDADGAEHPYEPVEPFRGRATRFAHHPGDGMSPSAGRLRC